MHIIFALQISSVFKHSEKPAEFTLQLKNQTVSETDTAEFTICLTKPNIQVTWKKNGLNVTPDERVKIVNEDLTYKLIITTSQLTDADSYSVILPNGLASEASLVVIGELLMMLQGKIP